jgi:hypothetical protein
MKQETFEEAAERLSEKHHYAFGQQSEFYQLGFYEGAKWQAERMYSEEEVIHLLAKFRRENRGKDFIPFKDIQEWFKKIKK